MKRFDTKVGYLSDDAVSVVATADLDKLGAARNELRDRVRAAENGRAVSEFGEFGVTRSRTTS